MFKEPFPKHDKGKAKVTDDQTNYTRTCYNYDSTINHILMDNYVSTIIIKDKASENSTRRPRIVLEEKLGKTLALISILELLRISPTHKAILDKILRDTAVPTDLNVDQFQAMVGYLSIPHSLTFIEADDTSVSQPHNAPLHIEAFIHKHRIKRVLIDGGAGLNICTLSTITQLGYSDKAVNSTNQITIKAYDDEERSSKGTITLPLRVGPVTKDVVCQVLDLNLTYNIFLGHPWIHEMRAVPSTYHQCIKFPHNCVEVIVNGDPNPFTYYNNLKSKTETIIPSNHEVVPLSAYIDLESLKPLTSKQGELKGIIEPLQPELTFKKEHLKGLGFLTSKVHTQRIEEALRIKATKIQQEDCYSIDSNEWEWGSDKSSSDYELTEIFRELDEPTEEEEFYNKFRVGQETTHEGST
ncbi:hypothetical protein SUGI_0445470 [Cryptomeria japonica]|nr:hypothetical protein SUGI_0445470 [Cryptomeria japonica]